MEATITVLLTTFPGLDLPRTLSLPLPTTTTLQDLHVRILSYLPSSINPSTLLLTTSASRRVPPTHVPISTLQSTTTTSASLNHNTTLSLSLRPRTYGGKGGFGSQLRAAGGRMSTKKKNGKAPPNSNRNLDGRRMRTIDEAKKLTEYLAVRPEMDRKEKQERYERWTAIVESSARKEEEMREGKGRKGDGEWISEKEAVEERVRLEIARGLAGGVEDKHEDQGKEEGMGSDVSEVGSGASASESSADAEARELETDVEKRNQGDVKGKGKMIWGWDKDDDDEDTSEDEDEK
ncbi:MAG: hypothetical protein Q9159_007747 [Coniocarpon cinnabarinum]